MIYISCIWFMHCYCPVLSLLPFTERLVHLLQIFMLTYNHLIAHTFCTKTDGYHKKYQLAYGGVHQYKSSL